jgi:two-component system, OmpR family, sensor histidine kinase KdpD
VGVVGLAAVTLTTAGVDDLRLSTVLLLALTVTVAAAATGGRWPGLATAVAAFLLANYLYTEPRLTLAVAEPELLVSLVVFLAVAGLVSHLVDVAVRREQEAALATEAARTERLRTALLQAVSHDLRTPLAGITASATSLLEDDVEFDADDTRAFLEAIVSEAGRLDRLVGNLLDMSRLRGGGLVVRRDAVSLADVVAIAVADQPDVTVDLEEPAPLAVGDEVLLERVVSNLVDNAHRHGAPPVHVEVRALEGRVHVRVVDRGAGIPAEERERVFAAFECGPGPSRGVGLGLAVSRGFVEAMGGRLVVADTSGGGTAMVVDLAVAEGVPR